MTRLATALILIAFTTVAIAGEPNTETVRLALRPAAVPSPVLKHRLAPALVDQAPGNAAILYLTAARQRAANPPPGGGDLGKEDEQTAAWLKAPLADFPAAAVKAVLDRHVGVLDQMRLASVRDRCDFDPPFRTEGFRTLLPYLNDARPLARLVALRARYRMAAGDLAGSVDDLRVLFVQGRHLNAEPFLVQSLVAAMVTGVALEQLQGFVQLKDAPNLYWALAELPAPLFDLRAAMRYEHAGLYFSVPALQDARAGRLKGHQWSAVVEGLVEMQQNMGADAGGGGGANKLAEKFTATAMIVRDLPAARKHLAEARNLTDPQLDALPPAEVVGNYYVAQFEAHMQELQALAALPFPQGYAGMQRAEERLRKDLGGVVTPVRVVLPAVSRAYVTLHTIDRRVAMLRTVEAIRAHAAANDGRPPKSLADVTATPVPHDPITGQPFAYAVTDDTVTLEARPVDGFTGRPTGLRFEIKLTQ